MNQARITVDVRFRDLDALGHVNYASYLSYMEEAINALWATVLKESGKALDIRQLGYITVNVTVDYKKPSVLGQKLEVITWVSEVGKTSFATQYEIRDSQDQQIIATAKTVQVVTLTEPGGKMMLSAIRSALEHFHNRPRSRRRDLRR
jgi:acyl-CoA thioester hydrolase